MSDDCWEMLWASLRLSLDWAAGAGKDILKNVLIYDINNEMTSFRMRGKMDTFSGLTPGSHTKGWRFLMDK